MITFHEAETENNCPAGSQWHAGLVPETLCLPEKLQISLMLVLLKICDHVYCGDSSTVEENEFILDDIEWPI